MSTTKTFLVFLGSGEFTAAFILLSISIRLLPSPPPLCVRSLCASHSNPYGFSSWPISLSLDSPPLLACLPHSAPLPLRPCPPSQRVSVVIPAGIVLNYAAACTWCYGLVFSPLILTVKSLWVWLSQGEGGGLFDLILTAETLYTTAVADKVGAARDTLQ